MSGPLPADRLEWVPGWGQAVGAAGYVHRPSTPEAATAETFQ